MDELSKAARDILSELRASEAPSRAARERVRGRLAATIGGASAAAIGTASASAGASTSVAASGAATIVSASKFALWVAFGTLGASAVLTPVALLSERPRPAAFEPSVPRASSRNRSTRAPLAPAPLVVAPPPVEPLESAPSPPPSSVRAAPRHIEAEPANNLSAETELLARVREQLRAGRTTESLALLSEHARRFPNGVLAEEAAASRVLALCSAGRVAEAEADKALFYAKYPRSLLGPRLERACAR